MSSVSGPPSEFPQFLRLPAEIRDLIWALCLPYRVREIDQPADCIVFRDRPTPCLLGATTRHNGRAPLISQVCPESRTVALKTRRTETFPSPPDPAYWTSSNWARYVWADSRDAPHLNWRFAYAADFGSYGDNPISRLAWETSRAGGRSGSLMLKFFARGSHYSVKGSQFDDFESIQYRDREILRRFPKWQVVMDVVIIHLDSVQDAVATGLFGLFGEEYVKILDAADERICDKYYELAEQCGRRAAAKATAPQKIVRQPVETLQKRLTDDFMHTYEFEELAARMHAAIMFRLCVDRCNKRELTEEDYDY